MAKANLARLNEADRLIRAIAADFGLDCLPQEFDVIPDQKMLEMMAYGLPVNFSHWSFGRNYEIERTEYEHGYGVPYEIVFNSDPARAYLMETNPFPIQVLVIAHVYGHNDFMKNSRHFLQSRRDMISSASEAAARFRRYEEDYGIEAVESLIDAGMAIQWNIDPDEGSHRRPRSRPGKALRLGEDHAHGRQLRRPSPWRRRSPPPASGSCARARPPSPPSSSWGTSSTTLPGRWPNGRRTC